MVKKATSGRERSNRTKSLSDPMLASAELAEKDDEILIDEEDILGDDPDADADDPDVPQKNKRKITKKTEARKAAKSRTIETKAGGRRTKNQDDLAEKSKSEKTKKKGFDKDAFRKKCKKLTRKQRKALYKEAKSLYDQNLSVNGKQMSRAERKIAKKKLKIMKPKSIVKRVLLTLLAAILIAAGAGAVYIYNILGKTSETFEGSPFDFIVGKRLKQDENGWSNALIFGTSVDDEGHGGAMLADSIMVVSVNQDKHIAKTLNIPRDLWVNNTIEGEDDLYCSVGYKAKVNTTYMCAHDAAIEEGKSEEEAIKYGSEYFARKISEITGLDIQYYGNVDYTVLQAIVDDLGGIDVDVYADDERGIYDYDQGDLRLKKGMNYGLDGNMALRLARARNAHGYYGLSRSNFDREINQQRIINAILKKATSVGVLANPNKVFNMLDSLGEHLTTNVSMAEIRQYLDVMIGLSGGFESIDTANGIFGTGRIGEQSVVVIGGAARGSDGQYNVYNSALYDYSKLQEYIADEYAEAIEETETSAESAGAADDDENQSGSGGDGSYSDAPDDEEDEE